MDDSLNTRLSWAIYIGRQSDHDYDLVAIMPATERFVDCNVSADELTEAPLETVAYHLAHEFTAALQYEGEDAIMISGYSGAFTDVLTGDGSVTPPPGPGVHIGSAWWSWYRVN